MFVIRIDHAMANGAHNVTTFERDETESCGFQVHDALGEYTETHDVEPGEALVVIVQVTQ